MTSEEASFGLALKIAEFPPLSADKVKVAYRLALLAKEKSSQITLMEIAKIQTDVEKEHPNDK